MPALLEAVAETFREELKNSRKIAALRKKLAEGKADYGDADEFAAAVGEALAAAYGKHVSSITLPDGKMYYNIAERLIPPGLRESYMLASQYAEETQQLLNKMAGIGIRPQRAEYNLDREKGLIEYVVKSDQYDLVRKSFEQDLINFVQAVVTETLRQNAEFQYQAGLSPVIRRTAQGGCCDWCARLVGIFPYEEVRETGSDVYRRHRACRCKVTYDPGDGRRQDVHTKRWEPSKDVIEKRKAIGENPFKDRDVLKRYWNNATPGRGNIDIGSAFGKKGHEAEIKTAIWLHETFGGDIRTIPESKRPGEKTPDYQWNGLMWDLKTVSTEKAADNAIRHGMKQIYDNPGGIILDYGNKSINDHMLKAIIDKRMLRHDRYSADIMVVKNGKPVCVLRY